MMNQNKQKKFKIKLTEIYHSFQNIQKEEISKIY